MISYWLLFDISSSLLLCVNLITARLNALQRVLTDYKPSQFFSDCQG